MEAWSLVVRVLHIMEHDVMMNNLFAARGEIVGAGLVVEPRDSALSTRAQDPGNLADPRVASRRRVALADEVEREAH